MSYWGSGPVDSDYATNTICSYVYLLKKKMLEDMSNVLTKSHPEQHIIASIQLMRLLASEFPKCFAVHFGISDFRKFKTAFEEWYEVSKGKIPKEYREKLMEEAVRQFDLFEDLYS